MIMQNILKKYDDDHEMMINLNKLTNTIRQC